MRFVYSHDTCADVILANMFTLQDLVTKDLYQLRKYVLGNFAIAENFVEFGQNKHQNNQISFKKFVLFT